MPSRDSDDTPFNPFYIGPHPSKACAAPEIPGQQCSPPCQECKEADQAAVAALPASDSHGISGMAGAMVIVGMAGPSGGVATIYSTAEALTAAAKAAGPADNPCAGKKMIECMQGGQNSDKACE